jgi:transcription initiation factor TFIIH subunit 4
VLNDLKHLGIVYQRKKGSSRFYPTRLSTTLLYGTDISNQSTSLSSILEGNSIVSAADSTRIDEGYIILETNYRVYAYTNSPLQIAVLSLFVSLKARFCNMIVGMITRESIRAAISNGITAEQIINYISKHAHPELRKKAIKENVRYILPITVVDQIRLWEMERNRLTFRSCCLYSNFNNEEQYSDIKKYSERIGVYIWSNRKKLMIAVTNDGHEMIKNYVKSKG